LCIFDTIKKPQAAFIVVIIMADQCGLIRAVALKKLLSVYILLYFFTAIWIFFYYNKKGLSVMESPFT